MTHAWGQRLATIAGALMITLSVRTNAQIPASAGIALGLTAPVSAFGSDKNVGYHLAIMGDFGVPSTPFGVRLEGAYHELKYSGNSTRDQILMATADALLKVPTGTMFVPYLIGGVGVYNSHRNLLLVAHSTTDVGANFGGGIRFELRDVTTFVEARYHRTTGDANIRMLPVSLGIFF
ncbi:MAG TPA: outer membrane beta-barrel protein [Gemmatimonadaceae bacterium]|nr:outer membrane beta-barrel protein [Gemmatimonadaceae bacterium]